MKKFILKMILVVVIIVLVIELIYIPNISKYVVKCPDNYIILNTPEYGKLLIYNSGKFNPEELKDQEEFKNINISESYSDGVVLISKHNFNTDDDEYSVYTPDKVIGTFKNINVSEQNKFVEPKTLITYRIINPLKELITNLFKLGESKVNFTTELVESFEPLMNFQRLVTTNNAKYRVYNNSGRKIQASTNESYIYIY